LVLGAGGIRGCAHAGVISVLDEAGVPVDIVVGVSTGALFGTGVAAGVPADFIASVARAATSLTVARFYAGRLQPRPTNPIGRMLLDAAGGKDFCDLPLPFAVVATDMNTGTTVTLDHGPVLRAVQASMALPFIARPVALNGGVYVDGGLYDTAPVHVARAMGAEVVIAVRLGNTYRTPAYLRTRPWTRPLLHRLGAQQKPVSPRFIDQVRFGCRLYAAAYDPPPPGEEAEVNIWPEFGRIGPNSMRGAAFCFDQGAKAAREALPDILRLACVSG
jgi:predicted acylesterase/phospholipase RssA